MRYCMPMVQSMPCTVFLVQYRHTANMIQQRQDRIELQPLGMRKALKLTLQCFCRDEHVQTVQRLSGGPITLIGSMKNVVVQYPEKAGFVYSGFGKVNSPLKWMQTSSWSVAGIMEKQVVDAFNKTLHHWQWLKASEAVSSPTCLCLQDPCK